MQTKQNQTPMERLRSQKHQYVSEHKSVMYNWKQKEWKFKKVDSETDFIIFL